MLAAVECGDRARGCLLGGAIGDALGAPLEFLSLGQIRGRFGPAGVTGPVPAYGRIGAITDDTQMTLFTAEGLLGARRRGANYGISAPEHAVFCSYLRWLATQGVTAATTPRPQGRPVELRGLLWDSPELHHRRAPGTTCLDALRAGRPGSPERPLNASKGCGGVMRAAPAAWAGGGAAPSAEVVERLGQGWVAEEALAIALYATLVAGDFRDGVLLAVNHSGDSDSTGAIAGNLLGALGGEAALPAEWVEPLEARDLIRQIATDLCQPAPRFDDDPEAWREHERRYPYYE